jgi:hypothetical protein
MERLRAWWQASPYESRHRTAHFPLRAASPRAAETWEVWDGQDLTETSRKNNWIPLNLPHDDFTSPATPKSDEGNGLV